jgi:hypothetical protein
MKLPVPAVMEAFLLPNIQVPFNFVFAVRLGSRVTAGELRAALQRTGERHPLACMRVETAPDGTAWLESQDVPEIPLRVAEEAAPDSWQSEALIELGSPFDVKTGPFVRLVCLQTEQGSDLLLTFDHPVCDGMSGMYFARDFLRFLGDPELRLDVLPPIPGSAYELLPSAVRDLFLLRVGRMLLSRGARAAWPLIQRLPRPALPAGDLHPWQRFHMLTGRLSRVETQALLERCRAEKTTIHAALCAAWLRADAQVCGPAHRRRRVSSAFSLRDRLVPPPGETFGLFMGMSSTSVDCHPGRDFWVTARALNLGLKRQTGEKRAFDWVLRTHALLSGLTHAQRREVLGVLSAQKPDYDLAVTNLGRLDWPAQCGQRSIEAVYGPLVNGFPFEKTVCALTFDGCLSYAFLFRDFVLEPAQGECLHRLAIENLLQSIR